MVDMASTHADSPGESRRRTPIRLWLLLLASPIGYVVGSTIGYDYGAASGVLAACVYAGAIGAYAVFGAQCRVFLSERRAVSAFAIALFTFVTLAGLHVFTPTEDLAVAAAAGLAGAALIAES